MNDSKFTVSASRTGLQQQPSRIMDRQQQQSSGSHEFQPKQSQGGGDGSKGSKVKQMGEGSYEGTRDYQDNIESYLKTADVKSDAKAAKPGTPQEEAELKKAEEEGLSHSKSPGQ